MPSKKDKTMFLLVITVQGDRHSRVCTDIEVKEFLKALSVGDHVIQVPGLLTFSDTGFNLDIRSDFSTGDDHELHIVS